MFSASKKNGQSTIVEVMAMVLVVALAAAINATIEGYTHMSAVLDIDATIVDTETHVVYAIHTEGVGQNRRSCMSARYDESGQLVLDTSVEPEDGERFVASVRGWRVSTEADENGVLWLVARRGAGKNATMGGCVLLDADGSAQTV